MSVNHTQRIEGVVKGALKEAAVGESYGFAVSGPAMWPLPVQGRVVPAPAWFVIVTIRNPELGGTPIGQGAPVAGVLPADESFTEAAVALLEECRKERDAKKASALDEARKAFQQSMERRG